MTKERIAKYLARAGVASRREIERMIADRRISVNGTVLDAPAVLVDGSEEIRVDGNKITKTEKSRLFLYYKPEGLVTSHKDEQARPTVFDDIKKNYPDLPRLISVGRLDLNTEGLLLLTNDGERAREMELPSNGWERVYKVRAFGEWSEEKAKRLKKGIEADGIRYGAITASLINGAGRNVWLSLSLKEGKNREIRKVLEALDLKVNKLIRLSYGPYTLDGLQRGKVEEVEALG
jgi:23S rRNA pseudouridine2605 synthase